MNGITDEGVMDLLYLFSLYAPTTDETDKDKPKERMRLVKTLDLSIEFEKAKTI
jgi:hypothetical protein